MIALSPLFVLLGLLHVAASGTIPTRTWVRKVQAAGAPAMPTSTLISDFKKNNISAKWAEGFPKQWGTEEIKYEFPVPLGGVAEFSGAVSEDEKFLAMHNSTDIKVIRLDTGALVSTPRFQYQGTVDRVLLRSAPEGQYDLIVSASNYTGNTDRTIQLRLLPDGTPVGQQKDYSGEFTSSDAQPLSEDRRRMLTVSTLTDGNIARRLGIAYFYDLDNAAFNLTLNGHSDWIMSGAFSPDGKYISTAAWDGYAKLWNANTGELVQSFGPSGGQNWLTRFSPDGKYVLVSIGSSKTISIWSLSNLTAPPITIGPFSESIRSAEWSSDSEYLATGESGELLVYSMSERKTVQTWQMEDRIDWVVSDLTWLEGSKKLAYRTTGGLEMYDFEKNLKYRWGPGDYDHYNYGSPVRSTWVIKTKGWIGGVDADQKIRLWKYPA